MRDDGLHLNPQTPASLLRKGNRLVRELEDLVEALRMILDNAYSGIVLCDRDRKILYMNRFYADLLKTDKDEALGKHIKTFFPDSRLPGVVETGEIELGQKCSLRADVALVVNRIPVKMGGETIGVLLQTIFKDYTEINELMARLNLLEKEVKYYKRGLNTMLSATYIFDSIVEKNARISNAKRATEKCARTDTALFSVRSRGHKGVQPLDDLLPSTPRYTGILLAQESMAAPWNDIVS